VLARGPATDQGAGAGAKHRGVMDGPVYK